MQGFALLLLLFKSQFTESRGWLYLNLKNRYPYTRICVNRAKSIIQVKSKFKPLLDYGQVYDQALFKKTKTRTRTHTHTHAETYTQTSKAMKH